MQLRSGIVTMWTVRRSGLSFGHLVYEVHFAVFNMLWRSHCCILYVLITCCFYPTSSFHWCMYVWRMLLTLWLWPQWHYTCR